MLAGIIFIWLITAIGLWIANMIVPGIHIKSTSTLFKAALGLINALKKELMGEFKNAGREWQPKQTPETTWGHDFP